MNTKRFTPWIVFVCMGALAACTGGDDTAGNTELNVIVPADPSNTGTPSQIDIQDIEYTIDCQGNSEVFLDNAASFPDEVTLNGNLEVVDGRPAPPGSSLANSEIWQGFGDLPPGPCTVQLRAKDGDGEVICTATEPFSVAADSTTKVDIVLICDISFQAPVGRLDVDGTFSFNVGNFCPDLFVLNCLDSAPAARQVLPPPAPLLAGTQCETRFRDGDSTCGQNCDPQTCTPTPEGLTCTPGPDPGVSTTVTCTNAITDCTGDGAPNPGCTWSGDTLGSTGQGPATFPGLPPAGTFFVTCIPPALGGTPGAVITCTAVTTDGDVDCDRVETFDITCPGLAPCADPSAPDCTDTSGETHPACVAGICDDTSGTAVCVFSPANQDGSCGTNPGAPTFNGQCNNGICEDFGCGIDADCDIDSNDCTIAVAGDCQGDGTCLPNTILDSGESCTVGGAGSGGDDGTCEAGGVCTGLCDDAATRCDDSNECTDDTCDVTNGQCSNTIDETNACTTCGSGTCLCDSAGLCIDDVAPGPPTFALAGEFRAYNSLLKAEGDLETCVGAPAGPGSLGGPVPAGPPVGTCTVPDLTTVPGSNTGGGAQIQAQCVTTQGIGGTLTFDDSSPPAVDMNGTFTLDFAIFAIIDLSAPACETILSVDIQTSSVNAVSGTDATGGSVSAGGSVTLDDRGDGFNVDYVSTGLVTCEGQPALFAQTVCTLAGMLNALPATNPLPLPGDPGGRFWPTFTFQDNADGNLDLQFATGPTTTAGWALSNPAPLNAPGTQFIAPTGVQQ